MTPFSLLEALGTAIPDIDIPAATSADEPHADAASIVGALIQRALQVYMSAPTLQSEALRARASERRQYIQPESRELFDACVMHPASLPDVTRSIANVLSIDHVFKTLYPQSQRTEVRRFFLALMLAAPVGMTFFRFVKQLWDEFYSQRQLHNPELRAEIEMVNRSMRLKTKRDLLDCDIIHFACYGWGDGKPVAAFTCDPPEVVLGRIAVYKGMLESLKVVSKDIPEDEFPKMNHGIVVRCDETGAITHVFPTAVVPAIT